MAEGGRVKRPSSWCHRDEHATCALYAAVCGCSCHRSERIAERAKVAKVPAGMPKRAATTVALNADDHRHGTDYAYKRLACRCDRCLDAHAEYERRRKERLTGKPVQPRPKLRRTPLTIREFCLCGCGDPVAEGWRSYASVACFFRGPKR